MMKQKLHTSTLGGRFTVVLNYREKQQAVMNGKCHVRVLGQPVPRGLETPWDVPESNWEVKYYWRLLRHIETAAQDVVLLSHVNSPNDPSLIQSDCEMLEGKGKDWGHPSVPLVKGQNTSTKMHPVDKWMAEHLALSGGLPLLHPRTQNDSFINWWQSRIHERGRETLKISLQNYWREF